MSRADYVGWIGLGGEHATEMKETQKVTRERRELLIFPNDDKKSGTIRVSATSGFLPDVPVRDKTTILRNT